MAREPIKEANDALYELGVMADIMGAVATADISGNKPVCGTSVDYFARAMRVQHERIEAALNLLGRA